MGDAVTTVAIVQARMGSARLPAKVMSPILGVPMIELLLRRLERARRLDRITLATSIDPRNVPLAAHVRGLGYDVYLGSEDDVLDRYYQAALASRPDTVVRITGDCPLVDPEIVDRVVDAYHAEGAEYASNTNPPTYPDGLDVEVFSFRGLAQAADQARHPFEREHVTVFLRESGCFKTVNVTSALDSSSERWTVDEPEDLEVVSAVFNHFSPRIDFGWEEVLALRQSRPELFEMNRHISRNQGAVLTPEQKIQKRAERHQSR